MSKLFYLLDEKCLCFGWFAFEIFVDDDNAHDDELNNSIDVF